jgi:hypothetical protein
MIKVFTVAALIISGTAAAQTTPPKHRHTTVGPQAPATIRLGQGPMLVDDWASLGTYAELPAGGASNRLDVKVAPDGAEEITVYGTRNRRDREWRDELRDSGGSGYEPGASEAGQPEYAKGPEWSSPDQQRLMSGAKEATGACGALFGLITCPGK